MARLKQKPQNRVQDDKFNYRLNRNITVPRIRLVGDNLDEISEVANRPIETGVYYTRDVLNWAESMEMDLVEISPKADPPVCKIIDFKKFVYDQKKREKELKAKTAKTVLKEIRFGPNTEKIKGYVQFKGRAIVFKDRSELLLLKFLKELEEYGAAEELPKLEGKRMIVMITPKKKK